MAPPRRANTEAATRTKRQQGAPTAATRLALAYPDISILDARGGGIAIYCTDRRHDASRIEPIATFPHGATLADLLTAIVNHTCQELK